MNLTPRTSRLAAVLIGAALAVALAGIAVDRGGLGAPGRLPVSLGEVEPPGAGAHVAEAEDVPVQPTGLGTEFAVVAPVGGVTARFDDTQVIVVTDGREAVTVDLNAGQTYVFGGPRTVIVSDRPVSAHAGRDRPVQPIR